MKRIVKDVGDPSLIAGWKFHNIHVGRTEIGVGRRDADEFAHSFEDVGPMAVTMGSKDKTAF